MVNDGFITQKTDDSNRTAGMTTVNDRPKQNHDVTRDIVKVSTRIIKETMGRSSKPIVHQDEQTQGRL